MSGDSLSTVEERRFNLDHLLAGIPLVNRLLGLRISAPRPAQGSAESLAPASMANADRCYLQLLAAIFGETHAAVTDVPRLMLRFSGFFDPAPAECVLQPAFDRVNALRHLDDRELVRTVSGRASVRVLDHRDVLDRPSHVFIKINHVHWEYITCRALASIGEACHRRMNPAELLRVEHSRSDELLVCALQRVPGAGTGEYDQPDFSLAVSYNNGDGYLGDDLVTPLQPIMRAAMMGCHAFFNGLLPAPHYRFTDGSFPKMLVWRDQMDDFFDRVKSQVDAVVFVVPDQLRGIGVRDWTGDTITIAIPSTMVSELWPAVLPVVASRLAQVLGKYRRVFVAVQAGHMSVPIGVLLQLMRPLFPDCAVHCVDMGQALDVAAYPGRHGPWLRQPELQETLQRAGRFPLYLQD